MHDDLTAQDIEMMQKELDHRKLELMPELIEEVKRTRAFGDLSENFEYKAAKQAQNRNRSRIRYLERMIKSAHVLRIRQARMRSVCSIRWNCCLRTMMTRIPFRW